MLSWITVFGCLKAVDYKAFRAGSFHLNSSTWFCARLKKRLLSGGSYRMTGALLLGQVFGKGLLHPHPKSYNLLAILCHVILLLLSRDYLIE